MTTQSLNQYQPFLFKRVSLISVNFLRYEGNLIAIQENTNSLMLSNVKCFGTEDREVAKPIPAAQEIYEYIIFKEPQIKTLNLSNDQFIYSGMNPMMYHNMPYPPNFMGGAQSFFPGFPMYYYNWPYGQMPPMNNYMQQNMNQEPRSFGEFNNPSFDMNRDLNLNVMQNQNMNESFDVKKDVNFDGMGTNPKSNQTTFKVESNQNKPNDQTQMKLNEVQMKMGELNLKQNEAQTKPQNDTPNKSTDVSPTSKQTEVHNQPKTNDLNKNITQEKKELKNITETKPQPQHDVKTQNDIKNQNDAKNTQNIVKTDTPTPKSNEVKTKEKTSEEYYKSSNENKYYDKNKNLDDTSYKKNYNSNNRYNNRYNNNGNQYNRYNNGNYNNNYNKGPRRYNNDRPNFNSDVTVDIFEATKKFEKEKELAQIEAEFQKQREEGNLPEDLDPEKAYDPTSSIFDNLSCETTDKKNNKRINKMERQKQLKEQERIDAETFGLSYNNSGYSNNFANRTFPSNKPFRNNTNYSKGPNPSHRQHNPRQQYTPKGQQKKVFRVKNTNEQD